MPPWLLWPFISAGSTLATNKDNGSGGLLGIYSEADRIRRCVLYPSETARLTAIVFGGLALIFLLLCLVGGSGLTVETIP